MANSRHILDVHQASVSVFIETNDLLFLVLRNSTTPFERANRVWSLPMPTFSPRIVAVPLWRTMMFPAMAFCPPEYLDAESFTFRLSSVLRTTDSFLVCHGSVGFDQASCFSVFFAAVLRGLAAATTSVMSNSLRYCRCPFIF